MAMALTFARYEASVNEPRMNRPPCRQAGASVFTPSMRLRW